MADPGLHPKAGKSAVDNLSDDHKDIWSVAAHATVPDEAYEYHARKETLGQTLVYRPFSSLMPVVPQGMDKLPAEDAKWAWVRK